MSQVDPQPKTYTLTTRNLFKHFLLLHDFLYNFSKTQARSSFHLDAQLDVSRMMNNATLTGTKCGQFGSFGIFALYCFKSKNIPMKFVSGFFLVYWLNHFATLGSYLGALIKIPSAYHRVGNYFTKYEPTPNVLDKFEEAMETQHQYEDTHEVLQNIFPEEHAITNQTFIKNDYFIKNKDKYNFESQTQKNSLKLPYLDSFLTRYFYHSFTRWIYRVKLFMGAQQQ